MDQREEGTKSPLDSKTVHFNILVWVVWPFVPKAVKSDPNVTLVIMAYITIGNLILRFMTKTALSLFGKKK